MLSCLSRAWQPTKSGEGSPSAGDIYWDSKILNRWMAEKNAENVEHVMPIIGKRERMDDGVVADDYQHDCHCDTDDRLSWVTARIGEGPYSLREVLRIQKRPGEEGKIRPDVDHLRKMD